MVDIDPPAWLWDAGCVSQAERIAQNEVAFREINDRIEVGHSPAAADERIPFCCECGKLGCNILVELTIPDYEAIRADPRQFFVVPGHEIPEVEKVVSRRPEYLVVEKFGEAGEVADAADPRHD